MCGFKLRYDKQFNQGVQRWEHVKSTCKLVSRKVDVANPFLSSRNLSPSRSEHGNGNDTQEKKHLQFLLFLLLLNALLYRTITSVIMFASIVNVDEGNNIRVVNPQKDKCKRLCIKVGRGKGTGTLGRMCGDLGLVDVRRRTWGHQVWDAGMCGMGTQGNQIQGRRGHGMWIIIAKVGGKCDISHFPHAYVLVKAT